MDVDDPLITRYLKRSAIRRMRPRPSLHVLVDIPMWAVLLMMCMWVRVVFGNPGGLVTVVQWAIVFVALFQWWRWGRRS